MAVEKEACTLTDPESHPNPLSIDVPPPQSAKSGCRRGCLVVLAIIFIPYLINALIVLSGSLFNQIKWHTNGSPNYTITVSLTAMSPIGGESIVTVENGKIISGTNGLYNTHGGGASGLEVFREVTIENIFERTYGCALFFPLLTCYYAYDQQFGYPTEAYFEIHLPVTEGSTHVTISKVQVMLQ
jgi:hypothetical protein